MKKYKLIKKAVGNRAIDIKLSEFEELTMIFGFPTKEEEEFRKHFNRFISEGGLFK